MKILFLGDYSGCHTTLATQLRAMGHECVVVSNGSRCMDTVRDIDLNRKPGITGAFAYLASTLKHLPKFRGYDVVQIVNPSFLQLRPGKLRYIFDYLKRHNGIVSLTLAGSDSLTVEKVVNHQILRYSEIQVDGVPTPYAEHYKWFTDDYIAPGLMRYCRYIYDNIDGAISLLYEYHLLAQPDVVGKPLVYAGIPVDVDALPFTELPALKTGKLNMMVAIKEEMMGFKGTDRMLAVAKQLEQQYPDRLKISEARNLKLKDYLTTIQDADIVLDQLYSFTPATNALQTMALGRIAVSGGEPEYYDFIGERDMHPVVNAVPDDETLYRDLERLIHTPIDQLAEIARQGRQFVEKHNSNPVVAQRFLTAWQQMAK